MTRDELMPFLVLGAVADDYENFNQICEDVSKLGRVCGFTIAVSEILQALITIIEAGLVKAYRLSPTYSYDEIQGIPPEEEIANPWIWYFCITNKGIEELSSNRERFPFDDVHELRKDRIPPAD